VPIPLVAFGAGTSLAHLSDPSEPAFDKAALLPLASHFLSTST